MGQIPKLKAEIQRIEKQLYDVAEFAFEHGELLKAYDLLKSAPLILKDSVLLANLFNRVKARLDMISGFQTTYRTGTGFADPDVRRKTCYDKLVDFLNEHKELNYLLDVGCFSGWVGRNLSLWGIKVHGVDLSPEVIQQAVYLATGTRASYEVLEATKVGEKYPSTFDGAIMFDVVEHVFDHNILLASVENAVRPGGYIVINLPYYDNAKQMEQPHTPDIVKEHLRAYSDEDVAKLFGNKEEFESEVIYEDDIPSYFITYKK